MFGIGKVVSKNWEESYKRRHSNSHDSETCPKFDTAVSVGLKIR